MTPLAIVQLISLIAGLEPVVQREIAALITKVHGTAEAPILPPIPAPATPLTLQEMTDVKVVT